MKERSTAHNEAVSEQPSSETLSPGRGAEVDVDPLPEPLFTAEGWPVYPLASVARHVGLSRKQLFDVARQGKVRAARFGKEWAVNADDAKQYRATRRLGRPPKRAPADRGLSTGLDTKPD